MKKLKKWVKVVLMLISMVVAYIVATKTGVHAVDNKVCQFVCVVSWGYLFLSFGLLGLIEEN